MSSREYSTVLEPEPRLRALALLCGAVAAVAGVVVAATLPVAALLKTTIAAAWLALVLRELAGLVRAYRRCSQIIVLPDGTARIIAGDGRIEPGQVLASSLVLGRAAWLRIRSVTGRRWAEPVVGNCRESGGWRRFQVIWRHLGTHQ